MTNPFGNFSTEGMEEAQDRLGGFAAKESDVYQTKIKALYAGQSTAGARNVTVILSGGDLGAEEYRETIYVTKQDGVTNWYENPNDKTKKVPLPGYQMADDIALCAVGVPLNQLNFEEKVMNIYDPEQQKEMPKSVQMAVDALGKDLTVAILKTKELRQKKNPTTGQYEPVGDGSTRDVNTIDKAFNTETGLTVAEAKGKTKAGEGKFLSAWREKNKGVTRDRTNAGGNGKAGGPAPAAGNTGGAPRSSLFGGN